MAPVKIDPINVQGRSPQNVQVNQQMSQSVDRVTQMLGALAKAGVQTKVQLDARAAKEEEVYIRGLLANPSLTPEETEEIAGSAKFEVNQMLAKNKQGEILAQDAYLALQDELYTSADPVEARKAIAKSQQDLIERNQITDPRVLAGIHERYAQMAPGLIEETVRARRAAQDSTFIAGVAGDLTKIMRTQGPEATAAEVSVTYQVMRDMGKGDLYGDTVVDTMNTMIEESLNPETGNYEDLDEAIDMLDITIDSLDGQAAPGDIRKLVNARSRAIGLLWEGADSSTADDAFKAEVTSLRKQVDDMVRAGEVVPSSLYARIEEVGALSGNPSLQNSIRSWRQEQRGLSGTPPVQDARQALRREVDAAVADNAAVEVLPGTKNVVYGLSQDAMIAYDMAIAGLPYTDDPVEQAAAAESARAMVRNEYLKKQDTVMDDYRSFLEDTIEGKKSSSLFYTNLDSATLSMAESVILGDTNTDGEVGTAEWGVRDALMRKHFGFSLDDVENQYNAQRLQSARRMQQERRVQGLDVFSPIVPGIR
jgi:hypothetical protein